MTGAPSTGDPQAQPSYLNLTFRARPGCPRLCSIPAWQHLFQTAPWAAPRLLLAQILSICYANAAKITFYNL